MNADSARGATGRRLAIRALASFGGLAAAAWLFFTATMFPGMWELGTVDVLSIGGPTMGTRYNVSVVAGAGDDKDEQALKARIDARLAEVNQLMSTYDPQSELSLFNASESDEWFLVSSETASVTAAALGLASDSGGAYDPTVGPLVNLWGFGPGKRRRRPPTDEEIASATSTVGYALVEVRADPPSLRKAKPGVYADLSSIAKGHGVDAIVELLREEGYEAFMVEIGGEVRTAGTKPGDLPWRIGVEKADQPIASPTGGRLQRVVELVDAAMATSGDYRNFFEHDGKRYSHTIDPKTGRPVEHRLATVTVIADTCRDADGLATALLVLGPERGYDWAVERDVAALFVSRGTDETLTERTTPQWDAKTPPDAQPGEAE